MKSRTRGRSLGTSKRLLNLPSDYIYFPGPVVLKHWCLSASTGNHGTSKGLGSVLLQQPGPVLLYCFIWWWYTPRVERHYPGLFTLPLSLTKGSESFLRIRMTQGGFKTHDIQARLHTSWIRISTRGSQAPTLFRQLPRWFQWFPVWELVSCTGSS